MRGVWHDLRYGVRQLRKNPAFTAVAVVSLALGIGANTAIFSVVHGVLLRPLPYDQPEKVVHILGTTRGGIELRHSWLAYPEIDDVRGMNRTLAHVAAFQSWDPALYGPGEPTQLAGASVSASYFEIFGIRPAVGRFFLPEEDELGHAPVVVLSHGFWQQVLGGDPRILGETLMLGSTEYTVIGVAPAEFVDPFRDPAVWRSRPPHWDSAALSRLNHSWHAIARIRDRVTLAEAQADQDRLWGYLASEYPEANADDGARLMTAQEYMVGSVRTAVMVLLCAVGLVLLIACANVANLYLTRTVVRTHEVALRSALGAGRGRIVRQLLTEVCLLFLVAGAVGLYLAWVGLDALLALGGENLPRLSEIRIDRVVLGFTLLVSLLTGVAFGLTAAYRAVRRDLAAALQVAGRGGTGDRTTQRLRAAFVVAEIALTLILLAGGGLLFKSLWNVRRVEPGFQDENLLTLQLAPRSGDYDEPDQLIRLYSDILDRVTGLRGVRAGGAINFLPMSGGQNCEFVWRDDQPLPQAGQFADYDGPTCLEIRVVSPDYFRAMGIPVRRGRAFTTRDDSDAPPVAILSESAATLAASIDLSARDDVIGERVTLYESRERIPSLSREVVGVVGDVRDVGLSVEPPVVMYVPHAQEQDPDRRDRMTLVVRTERDPTDEVQAVRAAIWDVDERLSVGQVQTMSAVLNRSIAGPRFRTTLLLIFGALALLLAGVGVAGVVSYAVSQRIPEIGLRIALGAQSRDIYTTVMSQGIRLTTLGLALGLVGALAATRALSGLVYGVSPSDPLTFLSVALLMASIALLAIWVPARSALRVDPVTVLDTE